MNGYCQNHTEDSDSPLLTGRHKNKATQNLGKVYRVKINPPNEYPEIGCVEVNNAVSLLSSAYAEIEHLKNKTNPTSKWRCRRCGSIVDMVAFRCMCTQSPSPWEPIE